MHSGWSTWGIFFWNIMPMASKTPVRLSHWNWRSWTPGLGVTVISTRLGEIFLEA